MNEGLNQQKAILRTVSNSAFNLETMLRFASSGKDTGRILEKITQAISRQFALEEETIKTLGVEMPQSHLYEHRRLLEEISQQEKDWRNNLICGETFAEGVSAKIYLHLRIHDKPLADSILRTTR